MPTCRPAPTARMLGRAVDLLFSILVRCMEAAALQTETQDIAVEFLEERGVEHSFESYEGCDG